MGVIRKRCPLCGGKIIVSDFYTFSYDHFITKSGTLSRKYNVSSPGSINVSNAACENVIDESCSARWDDNSFFINAEGQFVDLLYTDEEN